MKTKRLKMKKTKKAEGDGRPSRALTAYNLYFVRNASNSWRSRRRKVGLPLALVVRTIKFTLDLATWLAL
jgi:hypothetical protein